MDRTFHPPPDRYFLVIRWSYILPTKYQIFLYIKNPGNKRFLKNKVHCTYNTVFIFCRQNLLSSDHKKIPMGGGGESTVHEHLWIRYLHNFRAFIFPNINFSLFLTNLFKLWLNKLIFFLKREKSKSCHCKIILDAIKLLFDCFYHKIERALCTLNEKYIGLHLDKILKKYEFD